MGSIYKWDINNIYNNTSNTIDLVYRTRDIDSILASIYIYIYSMYNIERYDRNIKRRERNIRKKEEMISI